MQDKQIALVENPHAATELPILYFSCAFLSSVLSARKKKKYF